MLKCSLNMKKTAVWGLALALLIPIFSFLVVHYFGKSVVDMPPHYYFDTIITRSENGHQIQDTVWHRVKNFKLVNQLGDSVSLEDMRGKVIVLDFFFTSCPSFCPRLSKNMQRLQKMLKKTAKSNNMVQLLSISVDPEHDSAASLKKYADKYEAEHDIWYFLTGDKKIIYDLAQEELHVGVSDGEKDDFVHTDRFILLDKQRVVRGYYPGQDSTMFSKLLTDISLLYIERPPKKRN